jgi:hypothetical protein
VLRPQEAGGFRTIGCNSHFELHQTEQSICFNSLMHQRFSAIGGAQCASGAPCAPRAPVLHGVGGEGRDSGCPRRKAMAEGLFVGRVEPGWRHGRNGFLRVRLEAHPRTRRHSMRRVCRQSGDAFQRSKQSTMDAVAISVGPAIFQTPSEELLPSDQSLGGASVPGILVLR